MELSAGVVGSGLVLVGLALLFLELHIPGWGGPGALGVVATIAGGFVLLDAGGIVSLPRSAVVALIVLAAIFVPVATVLVSRARRLPDFVNPTLVGAEGIAKTDLDPSGTVHIKSEEWSAESHTGHIEAGARVRVVGDEGLKLRVERGDG